MHLRSVVYNNTSTIPWSTDAQQFFVSTLLNHHMIEILYSSILLVVAKLYNRSCSQVTSLSSLCHQVLGQEISDFPLPDLALVAEHSDPVELGRLLQLILGCAVRCEHKQGM